MSKIAFSSPFSKSFVHNDNTVGTSASQILAAAAGHEHRIVLVVQNKSDSAIVQVILADTGSIGLELQPNQSATLENYNGVVRAISDTASTIVHVAYAIV